MHSLCAAACRCAACLAPFTWLLLSVPASVLTTRCASPGDPFAVMPHGGSASAPPSAHTALRLLLSRPVGAFEAFHLRIAHCTTIASSGAGDVAPDGGQRRASACRAASDCLLMFCCDRAAPSPRPRPHPLAALPPFALPPCACVRAGERAGSALLTGLARTRFSPPVSAAHLFSLSFRTLDFLRRLGCSTVFLRLSVSCSPAPARTCRALPPPLLLTACCWPRRLALRHAHKVGARPPLPPPPLPRLFPAVVHVCLTLRRAALARLARQAGVFACAPRQRVQLLACSFCRSFAARPSFPRAWPLSRSSLSHHVDAEARTAARPDCGFLSSGVCVSLCPMLARLVSCLVTPAHSLNCRAAAELHLLV